METAGMQMMRILRAEVCRDFSAADALRNRTEEEWMAVCRLAKRHDLLHLVGDYIIRMGLLPDGKLRSALEREVCTAVYRSQQLEETLSAACAALDAARIPYLPLKGSVLRVAYPEPWMRIGCDVDLLVHEADLVVAEEALVSAGFSGRGKKTHDVAFLSPAGFPLELHYQLMNEEINKAAERILQSVWERAERSAPESFRYTLPDPMFYYYHVAHMAKHYVFGGCGVRPFLDLWILNHNSQADSEARNRLLSEGGLLRFAAASTELSEVWFGSSGHTPLTAQMEEFLLHAGVYGNVRNSVAAQQAKKGSRTRYAISRIFLPYSTMRVYYPVLDRHKWLLPICQIRRWFRLLVHGEAGRGVSELKTNQSIPKNERRRTARMLSELGLDH